MLHLTHAIITDAGAPSMVTVSAVSLSRGTLPSWRDIVSPAVVEHRWQPTAPTFEIRSAGVVYRVRTDTLVDELPTISPTVALSCTLRGDATTGWTLVGRPVPEYAVTAASSSSAPLATLGPERFAPLSDARRLFLARYMPYSMTACMVCNDVQYDGVSRHLADRPWALYLEGYIDTQGLDRALTDWPAMETQLCAYLSTSTRPPADWWHRLYTAYAIMCRELALGAAAEAFPTDEPTRVCLDALTRLGIAKASSTTPGVYILRMHAIAVKVLDRLFRIFRHHGRMAGAMPASPATLSKYMYANDLLMLDMRSRYAAHRWADLSAITARAWLIVRHDAMGTPAELRRRFLDATAATPPRLPLVVMVDAHLWSVFECARLLVTLTSMPHERVGQRFLRTGSGVPFKLLITYNSLEHSTGWVELLSTPAGTRLTTPPDMVAYSACPVTARLQHSPSNDTLRSMMFTYCAAAESAGENGERVDVPNSPISVVHPLPSEQETAAMDDPIAMAEITRLRTTCAHISSPNRMHTELRRYPPGVEIFLPYVADYRCVMLAVATGATSVYLVVPVGLSFRAAFESTVNATAHASNQ